VTGKIELDEDIANSVVKAFQKGSEAGFAQANSLYQYFGLASNPFEHNILIDHPNLLIDKVKNIITSLAERIGACFQGQTNLIVIGPEGAGRTSILKLINATLNKGFESLFCSYIDARSEWHGLSSEENEDGERIDNFQKWSDEQDFTKTKIVLVDDADEFVSSARQYSDSIKFDQIQVPTMVYCITPTTHSSIVMKNDQLKDIFGDFFWIMPLENHEIKQILLESLGSANEDSNNSSSFSPFDNAAIDRIVDYSIGLPGLATWLALLCLKSAHQLGINKVDKTTVERVALVEGFATSLKVTQQQEKKLDGTKYNIAIEILTQFYLTGNGVERKNVIAKFSNMATSTLSYHFKDLINDCIIKQERIGFRVLYSIPKPIRSALQLLVLFPSSGGR
jgi:ATPase family associated with various cellular activities (AAA)